ncbi:hypothetical protein LAV79_29550 [Peribacillus butanolivorans]|uniref:hypothetical protein n=1 Tax=Peribacillus butanolivorans TaxID=421767 RepID=UPI0030C9086C
MSHINKFDFIKASIEDIDKIVSLRLALLKELGELKSLQEEKYPCSTKPANS